jgi:hypothetical protein
MVVAVINHDDQGPFRLFRLFRVLSRPAVRIRVGKVHITALRSADVGDDRLPILLDSSGGKLRAEVRRL